MPGQNQIVTAEANRLAKPAFEPVACGCRPDRFGYEYAIPELLSGLPDKGKKIGRKPLPLAEKRIDFDSAFQTRRAWQLTFSDQPWAPTVYGPWRADEPAPCGRFWSPSARGNRDRSVFCDSKVETFFSLFLPTSKTALQYSDKLSSVKALFYVGRVRLEPAIHLSFPGLTGEPINRGCPA
jgi:hypothetical protein